MKGAQSLPLKSDFPVFPSPPPSLPPQCFCPGIIHSLAARIPARIRLEEGEHPERGEDDAYPSEGPAADSKTVDSKGGPL